jgi:hypothetical protein
MQAELANLFPAVITIATVNYAAASSGIRRERDLLTGGWLDKWKVTFIVPVAAFVTAGKPVAKARDYIAIVSIAGVAPVIATVVVSEAVLDATGTNVTLRCENPNQ